MVHRSLFSFLVAKPPSSSWILKPTNSTSFKTHIFPLGFKPTAELITYTIGILTTSIFLIRENGENSLHRKCLLKHKPHFLLIEWEVETSSISPPFQFLKSLLIFNAILRQTSFLKCCSYCFIIWLRLANSD